MTVPAVSAGTVRFSTLAGCTTGGGLASANSTTTGGGDGDHRRARKSTSRSSPRTRSSASWHAATPRPRPRGSPARASSGSSSSSPSSGSSASTSGPSEMVATLLKVVVAVALSAALFIGANLLFDLAYDRWTLFNTIVGADRRVRRLRPARERRAAALAVRPAGERARSGSVRRQRVALGAHRRRRAGPRDVPARARRARQLARLPLAVVGFTGFGILTALALDESVAPVAGLHQAGHLRRHRRRRARPHRPRCAAAPRWP